MNKKPIYKKWWFWVAASFLFLFVVAGIVGNKDKAILNAAPSEIDVPSGAESTIDPSKIFAELKLHPNTEWDEEDALKNHFSKGITYAREVFGKYPEMERVFVKTYMMLMDVNGNEKEEIVFKHIFARKPFMEVNWDKFKYAPVFNQIGKSLEGNGYIHPALAKKISDEYVTDKMYYAP